MNKRAHRAALEAKRTLPPDDLTGADRDFLDADRERQKYDPGVQHQRDHDDIQWQANMLRTLGGSSI